MSVAVSLMASLFATIVLGVYGVISGAVDRKEGARRIVAALAALLVAVVLLRVLVSLGGDVLAELLNRVGVS